MQSDVCKGEIHLYFHSPCFDGVVSAVIASAYLERVHGYAIAALKAVNYNLRDKWLTSRLEKPGAIVDFLYHPDAEYWADHHPTAFLTEEAKADYEKKESPNLIYDEQATSCSILIWRRWGAQISDDDSRYEELVRWADKIDSAGYESVEEAVALRAPALQINLAMGTARREGFCEDLVHFLREQSLEEVAAREEVRTAFDKGWVLQQAGMERLKQVIRQNGEIAMFDVDGDGVMVNRYAPFSIYPCARYSIGVTRSGGKARLATMRNPWMDFTSAPLGEFCARFGGGGHQRVGAILLEGRDPKMVMERLAVWIADWEGNRGSEIAA